VFQADINRLLSMEDMWKVEGRVKPVALDYDAIMDGSFVAPPVRTVPKAKEGDAPAAPAAPTSGAGLKDQKELSLKENLELFIDR
jgi:ubiquitin-like 1-activating enzyme E1 B